MGILIDEDIAHIECVMRPSLCGFEDGPILPTGYWRRRLYRLLDSCHLTKVQLCAIDSLLLQLDQFELEQHDDPSRPRRPAPGSEPKAGTLLDAMTAGNSANRQHRTRLSSPVDEENRWDTSVSLAVAVQELMVDGLAATLNAVSAGHVLLSVHAMRLVQISGFEVWRNGMTQQPQTRRFGASSAS